MAGHSNPAGKTEDFTSIILMYFFAAVTHEQFIWVAKVKISIEEYQMYFANCKWLRLKVLIVPNKKAPK